MVRDLTYAIRDCAVAVKKFLDKSDSAYTRITPSLNEGATETPVPAAKKEPQEVQVVFREQSYVNQTPSPLCPGISITTCPIEPFCTLLQDLEKTENPTTDPPNYWHPRNTDAKTKPYLEQAPTIPNRTDRCGLGCRAELWMCRPEDVRLQRL